MALRLFGIYLVVEVAVVFALASAIGIGWALVVLAASFLLGLVLAGAQIRWHIRALRTSGITIRTAHGALTDGALIAVGTVLVGIPGLVTFLLGVLLLLPPTRAVARPLFAAAVARRLPPIPMASTAGESRRTPSEGYPGAQVVDGEVVDVEPPPAASPVRPERADPPQ